MIAYRPSNSAVDVWVPDVGTRRLHVMGSVGGPSCSEVAALACGWSVLFPGVPAGNMPSSCVSDEPTTCGEAVTVASGESDIDDPGSLVLHGFVTTAVNGYAVTATIARFGREGVSGQVTWLASGPRGAENSTAAAIAFGCAAVGNDTEVGSTLASWLVDGADAAGASLLVQRSGRTSPPSGPPVERFERLIGELASVDWTACSRP